MFKVGDKVTIKSAVIRYVDLNGKVSWDDSYTCEAHQQPHLVLGWTHKRSGQIYYDDYSGTNILSVKDTHKLWYVQPLTGNDRWIKPILAREEEMQHV